MVEYFTTLADFLIKHTIEQSVSSLPLFIAVFILSALYRLKYPKVIHALWGLFFVRLVLPVGRLFELFHFDEPLKINYTMDPVSLSVFYEYPAAGSAVTSADPFPVSFYILIIWLASAVFLLARLLLIKLKIRKTKVSDLTAKDIRLQRLISNWRKIFSINKPVNIHISDRINSAFNSGVFAPSIFLPASYLNFSSQELEIILAHECAHIRRHDNLKLFIIQLLQCLLFFNPLVWTAARQMNICREQICDLMVINRGRITPFIYGSVLLDALQKPDMRALNTGFSFYKSFMKIRLKTLTRGKEMKKSALVFIVSLTLSISLFSWGYSAIPIPVDGPSEKKMFLSPLKKGKITSRFGERNHPILKVKKYHEGIDIAAPKGTSVYATANGMVQFAERKGGYGKVIYIKHADGWNSVYAQLSEIKVKKGDEIKQGHVIGLVGSSGLSTAPHLHFELRKDEKAVNPDNFIIFNINK